MSNSGRRSAAGIRQAYSRETHEAARAGVGRKLMAGSAPDRLVSTTSLNNNLYACDHDLGIDSCTDAQALFRSILALGLFNRGNGAEPPAAWLLSTLTWYTITPSPRWDRLVFITNAPDNIMNYFVEDGFGAAHFPGMRLVGAYDYGRTLVARHMPTGAEFVSTDRRDGKLPSWSPDDEKFYDYWGPDDPLTAEELRELDWVPAMTGSSCRLLAGLVTRLSMTDVRGRWTTGNWYWDPLRRARDERHRENDPQRRLWGEGHEWTLEWSGLPFPEDLVLAMTDPVVGIQGIRQRWGKNFYELVLGSSVLRVRK